MRPRRPPLRRDLPELPRGCEELQATTEPEAETRLKANLDFLSGFGVEEVNLLSRIAEESIPSTQNGDTVNSSQRVLGLADLIRTQRNGLHALHPRVQQVLPVGVLDWILESIATQLDRLTDTLAYQYPHYLLECRGAAPDKTSLYPPEYHIGILDMLREFRANDILTTVCQRGGPVPQNEEVVAAVEAMESRNQTVNGVFTLRRNNPPRPHPTELLFHDDIELQNAPSRQELLDHFESLRTKFAIDCRFVDITTHRAGTTDE